MSDVINVTRPRWLTVDAPHSVTSSCYVDDIDDDGADRLRQALAGAVARGSAGRLVDLLRLLCADPAARITVHGATAVLPAPEMTMRRIADRFGLASRGTAAKWTRDWRDAGLLDAGPPPTVDLRELFGGSVPAGGGRRLGAVPGPPPKTLAAGAAGRASGEHLDVLLAHLRDAVRAAEPAWIEAVEHLVRQHLAGWSDAPAAARTARSVAQVSQSVSELERTRTHSLASDTAAEQGSAAARAARQLAQGDNPSRSVDGTLLLLRPLQALVDERGLVPVTDRAGLAAALQDYSDAQVEHAQSVILRQCRAQADIESPFGLLVWAARDDRPEYFAAPEPAPSQPEPPQPPQSPQPEPRPTTPEQRAHMLRRARAALAPSHRALAGAASSQR